MKPYRMSATLREQLESLFGNMLSDAPYASSDGMQRLKNILGYWCDPEGNKIENGDRYDNPRST